jgi:VanZ family protein
VQVPDPARGSDLRAWAAVALWTLVVLGFSSPAFSAEMTRRGLGPLIRLLGLTREQADFVHFLVRKGAHVVEYGVLGLLAFRAARRSGPPLRAAGLAAAIALAVAGTDEFHQSFEPSRTGRARDVVLDLGGASLGIVLWSRVRPAAAAVGAAPGARA